MMSDDERPRSVKPFKHTFEYGMAWPLRADHLSVHHPRKPNRIIALRNRKTLRSSAVGETRFHHTHDVDKFLNLAHTLGTDLTHLERHERTELIAL